MPLPLCIGDNMAESETTIVNMALARVGAKRINDYDDTSDTKPEAIQARLHYVQTRDALQRSHLWVFNKTRSQWSRDTVTPDFEYDYQFLIPSDFLRFRYVVDAAGNHNEISHYSHSIERKSDGTRVLLSDLSDEELDVVYSARITDCSKWDPLFTEVLILKLAKKFATPLAGSDKEIMASIKEDLKELEPRVRSLDRNEGWGTRQGDLDTWNDARLHASLGSTPTVAGS